MCHSFFTLDFGTDTTTLILLKVVKEKETIDSNALSCSMIHYLPSVILIGFVRSTIPLLMYVYVGDSKFGAGGRYWEIEPGVFKVSHDQTNIKE